MFAPKQSSLLERLFGIETDIATLQDDLWDAEATNRTEEWIAETQKDVAFLEGQRRHIASTLREQGMPLFRVEQEGETYHVVGHTFEPILPAEPLDVQWKSEAFPPPPPKKKSSERWKRYGSYAVAGLLALAAIGGFYVSWHAFKDWGGVHTDITIPQTNETRPNGRKNESNASELPELPPIDQPINQTPPNQTPPVIITPPHNQSQQNQTPQETPDYLKWLSSTFIGDYYFGRYAIADAEHNPNGNYSMRVVDAENRTVFETDLNDTEGEHNFQFATEGLEANKPYFVEILRNGTLAHEPFKIIVPNSPPSVALEAIARLSADNKSRLIDYMAMLGDDRGLQNASFYLYDAAGNLIRKLGETQLEGKKGLRYSSAAVLGEDIKAGKYHVLARVFDRDGSQSEVSADIDVPDLPLLPPPPCTTDCPPPPNNNQTNNTKPPPFNRLTEFDGVLYLGGNDFISAGNESSVKDNKTDTYLQISSNVDDLDSYLLYDLGNPRNYTLNMTWLAMQSSFVIVRTSDDNQTWRDVGGVSDTFGSIVNNSYQGQGRYLRFDFLSSERNRSGVIYEAILQFKE